MGYTQLIFGCKFVCTNREDEGCNGLENKPLGVHLQGVLVSSLDAVEHHLLVAVHCGILKGQQSIKCTIKAGRDANKVQQNPDVTPRYLHIVLLPGRSNLNG